MQEFNALNPKITRDLFIGAPVDIEEAMRLNAKDNHIVPYVIGSPEIKDIDLPPALSDLYTRVFTAVKYGVDAPSNIWVYDHTNTHNAIEQVIDKNGNYKPYTGYQSVAPLEEELIKQCIENIKRKRTQSVAEDRNIAM